MRIFGQFINLIGVILPLLMFYGCQPELDEGTPISISLVNPAKGPVEGGQQITIYGEGLGFVESVSLGGLACTDLSIKDGTEITCTTPGAIGAGSVDLSIVGKARKSGFKLEAYTYQVAPTLDSVSPTEGFASGGTLITITGSGFLNSIEEPIDVKIGGTSCLNINVIDSTSLECTTPVRSAGVKSIIVTNYDGQSVTLNNSFTFNAAPKITSITPDGGSLSGGTVITILGSGFKANDTEVEIGGLPCASLTVNSATNLTCTTTGPSSGAQSVVVTNLDTQTSTKANGFTYRAAPVISSISIDGGALSGGTSVVITGTGFLLGAKVKFGNNLCSGNGYMGLTSYYCFTPSGAAGTVDVKLTNPDGQESTLSSAYTYRPAPIVLSVTPNVVPVTLGGEIIITGSNFLAGATVTLGATPCPVSALSATSITCDAPAAVEASVKTIKVQNTDLQSGNLQSAVTYRAAPTVTAISPQTGVTSGGEEITITGTGFLDNPLVTVGGSACTSINFVSSTTVKCVAPAGTSGAATIVIENTDLQSAALASAYTYLTPANLNWDLSSHDYGNVTTNTSVIFELTNTGEQSTTAVSVSLTGADPSAWSLTLGSGNSCDGIVLESGESCTVEVTFLGASLAAGSYEADLDATATTGGTTSSALTAIRDP